MRGTSHQVLCSRRNVSRVKSNQFAHKVPQKLCCMLPQGRFGFLVCLSTGKAAVPSLQLYLLRYLLALICTT